MDRGNALQDARDNIAALRAILGDDDVAWPSEVAHLLEVLDVERGMAA